MRAALRGRKIEGALSKPTHLSVSLQHRVGTVAMALTFDLSQPWSVLFGPSGAGKTTILRAIAGLVRPQQGRIALRQRTEEILLTDTNSGVFLPPWTRGIGLVSQRPALFPHLCVAQNVAFGLRGRSAGSATTDHVAQNHIPQDRVAQMLQLFQASHLATRKPAQLSGGEAQRVALARALAPEPRLLLLDEPFTGLDIALKEALIGDLRNWLAHTQTPVLMVTHNLSEVFLAGAEVLVLEDGKMQAQGEAATVLAAQRALLLQQLGSAQR